MGGKTESKHQHSNISTHELRFVAPLTRGCSTSGNFDWLKSKLAEVEINWPKSNRWCLLCFFFLSFFFSFSLFFTFFLFLHISLFILFLFCFCFRPQLELNPKPRTLHPISLDNPPPDRPKFRSFFPLPPQFSFFFPSLEVLSLNYVLVFEGRAGATRELQTCTFWEPSASNTTKIHERTPRERKKKENCGGRSEKKSAKFWPPTLRALNPARPHPSRAPHHVVPKFNIQKLAEIELAELEKKAGRSRNWPKSIALSHRHLASRNTSHGPFHWCQGLIGAPRGTSRKHVVR